MAGRLRVGREGIIGDSDVEVVRIRGWERYGWLRHGFSTRAGGVSSVYGGKSLNLGWTKEDDPRSVEENRRRFLLEVCGEKASSILVGVRQIHSGIIRVVKEEDRALEGRLQTAEGKAVLEADGLMTNVPGVLLGVGTADCVPVLVVDVEKRVVAAFHAGWRGTVAQIVERGITMMREEYGSRVEDMAASVGPSIGACCYAVGKEVRTEFGAQFSYANELFSRTADADEIRLNLWEANRRQLVKAGVQESQIAVVGECTSCARNESGTLRYFSHRGEKGVAGRMLNVVGVLA